MLIDGHGPGNDLTNPCPTALLSQQMRNVSQFSLKGLINVTQRVELKN
jgi:hypothetical protein